MNKVVLFDLERNMPAARLLRELLQHYACVYLFNGQKNLNYPLTDLSELALWISAGQVVILETADAEVKEYEYALLVGQCLALLAPETHIDVVSAMPDTRLLVDMLNASALNSRLIRLASGQQDTAASYRLPSAAAFKAKPDLQLVKTYCDRLGCMKGKPATVDGLKNSIMHSVNVLPEKARQLIGILVKLKIVRVTQGQVSYRSKILAQWLTLNLQPLATADADQATEADPEPSLSAAAFETALRQRGGLAELSAPASDLYADFAQMEPVEWQVVRKLHEIGHGKPQYLHELHQLLETLFPQADVRHLLKRFIEKGYIHWDGHQVYYRPEMGLH